MLNSLGKIALSVSEVTEVAPLGKTLVYDSIRSGRLKAKRLGRKTLVMVDDLRDFLEGSDDAVDSRDPLAE